MEKIEMPVENKNTPRSGRVDLAGLVDSVAVGTIRAAVEVVNTADEVVSAVGTALSMASPLSMTMYQNKSAEDVVGREVDATEKRKAKRKATVAQLVAKFKARQAKRKNINVE